MTHSATNSPPPLRDIAQAAGPGTDAFSPSRLRPLAGTRAPTGRGRSLTELFRHDWVSGVLCLVLDIVCWLVLYGAFSRLRDALELTGSGFSFLVVEVVQLAVLLLAPG